MGSARSCTGLVVWQHACGLKDVTVGSDLQQSSASGNGITGRSMIMSSSSSSSSTSSSSRRVASDDGSNGDQQEKVARREITSLVAVLYGLTRACAAAGAGVKMDDLSKRL